ncbi:hypothetical protein ACFLUS_02775 [Chloroflexota bacterium]
MKTAINTLVERIEITMGDMNFKLDYDQALDSPEQLLEIGEHNLREYEKVEAMDEDRKERIRSIMINILAQLLQKEAIEQYGNTDDDSIRRTLHDWCSQPENQTYVDRLIETAKRGIAGFDFTEEQMKFFTEYFDALPVIMDDILVRLTSHLRLPPRAEAQSISMALADIMKKV